MNPIETPNPIPEIKSDWCFVSRNKETASKNNPETKKDCPVFLFAIWIKLILTKT